MRRLELACLVLLLEASSDADAWAQVAARERGCGEIELLPVELPDGHVHHPYRQTMTASGGMAPYAFSVTSGGLPPGLSLSRDGELAGLSGPGRWELTVTVEDAAGCTGRRDYELEVVCLPLTISPDALPAGEVDVPYRETITAGGATSPTQLRLKSGALPFGLTLSWAGGAESILSGAPILAGSYLFEVEAADGCSYGAHVYEIEVRAPPGGRTPEPRLAARLPDRRGR